MLFKQGLQRDKYPELYILILVNKYHKCISINSMYILHNVNLDITFRMFINKKSFTFFLKKKRLYILSGSEMTINIRLCYTKNN